MKKVLIIFLLALMIFTGCSKEPAKEEQGEVTPQEEPEQEDPYAHLNVFTKLDSPYDYEYTPFISEFDLMKVDVPSTWEIKAENSKIVSFTAPKNDPYFPGTRIYLLSTSTYPGTAADTVGLYGNFFNEYKPYLYFDLEGVSACQALPESPSEIITYNDFTDNGMLCTTEYIRNCNLWDPVAGIGPRGDYTMINYYIKWAGDPYCFTSVCEASKEKELLKLLSYIISSAKYVMPPAPTFVTATVGDVTIPIIEDSYPLRGNSFRVNEKNGSIYSGCQIGILKTEKPFKQNGSPVKDFVKGFLGSLGKYYNLRPMVPGNFIEETTVGGMPATKYWTCSMTYETSRKDQLFFSNLERGQAWYYDIHDTDYVIVVTCLEKQISFMDPWLEEIEKKTSVNN